MSCPSAPQQLWYLWWATQTVTAQLWMTVFWKKSCKNCWCSSQFFSTTLREAEVARLYIQELDSSVLNVGLKYSWGGSSKSLVWLVLPLWKWDRALTLYLQLGKNERSPSCTQSLQMRSKGVQRSELSRNLEKSKQQVFFKKCRYVEWRSTVSEDTMVITDTFNWVLSSALGNDIVLIDGQAHEHTLKPVDEWRDTSVHCLHLVVPRDEWWAKI